MELIKTIGYLFLLTCGYGAIELGAKVYVKFKEDKILAIAIMILGILLEVVATASYFY